LYKKIIFAGTAQNCGIFLPQVLKNIDRISTLSSKVAYVFVENDSIDLTKKILSNYGKDKKNFTLITLDGLNQKEPIRTLRIAAARNAYLEFIKKSEELYKFDYLIVLDLDNENIDEFKLDTFAQAFRFLEKFDDVAGVFANQIGTYYDMWALRHHKFCPLDIWEEVYDYSALHKVSDDVAFNNTFLRRIMSINTNEQPIEVESAFGGLGIYKLNYVYKNNNNYLGSKIKLVINSSGLPVYKKWQVCEHVNFNAGIRNLNKKLYIFPNLINKIISSKIAFYHSAFRQMLF
jgi:hypothetical protein